MSIIKYLTAICGVFLTLNGFVLLFKTNLNIGNLLCVILGLCLMSISITEVYFESVINSAPYRIFKVVICVLSISAFVCSCFLNIYGFVDNCDYTEDAVIVLGAGIRGTKVSLPLAYRLDSATEYLNKNQHAVVVVSGGQGHQEDISEAEAMKNYLISKGVEESRIICEDKSTSTFENFIFSKELLDRHFTEEYKSVLITNHFHVFRAERIAREAGLLCAHKGAPVKWYSVAPNSLRECLALFKNIVFGG